MNKYERNLKDLVDDQEILMLQIEQCREDMDDANNKHLRDYYKRELNRLYEDLYDSCLDIRILAYELMDQKL